MNFTIEIKRQSVILGISEAEYYCLREKLFAELVEIARDERDDNLQEHDVFEMRSRFEQLMKVACPGYSPEEQTLLIDQGQWNFVIWGELWRPHN